MLCDAYQLPDPDEYIYETSDEFEPLTVISYEKGVWPFHTQHIDLEHDDLIHVGVEERDRYQQALQQCSIEYKYRWPDQSQAISVIQHRYLYAHQVTQLIEHAGLKIKALCDGFTQQPAHQESEHWSCIAQVK